MKRFLIMSAASTRGIPPLSFLIERELCAGPLSPSLMDPFSAEELQDR